MAKFNHDVGAWIEYAACVEVLRVMEAATVVGDDWESQEAYGEQVAQIASERALAGMRDTASSDGVRIWRFERRVAALRSYAKAAPAMRDACEAVEASLWI